MSRRMTQRERRIIFVEGIASGVAFTCMMVGMVVFMLAW